MEYKIILTGGGTMGSVTPLLAVAEELRKHEPDINFLWLGTKSGPEGNMIESHGVNFISVPAGKLRRYFSWKNFTDPFLILAGFFKALWIIFKFKPQIILSAGGFVGVPVVWAGWILRVPSLAHQQDIRPGLANKLTAPFAKITTVALPESKKYFSKAVVAGNPVREEIFSGEKDRAIEFFKLEKDLPSLLVLGGGTGALTLNQIVEGAIPELKKFCQIVHIVGRGKSSINNQQPTVVGRYHSYEFLIDELKDAYTVADLVISRAGMGTLTELAALGKPTVLVPIPKSHQEDNAWYFKKNNAVYILDQEKLTSENFVAAVRELITNKVELENLSRNIRNVMKLGAAGIIAEEIFKIIKR